jgi:hypothetical protein
MRQPLIFDGRNLFDPRLMQRLGFDYRGIGRAAAHARPLTVPLGGAVREA